MTYRTDGKSSMSFELFLKQYWHLTKNEYLELPDEEQEKIDKDYLVRGM